MSVIPGIVASTLVSQTVPIVNDSDWNTASSGAATTMVVPVPNNSDGNFLVMFCAVAGNSTFTTPSGWTLIGSQSGGPSVAAFYRVASSEPASYTVTHSASSEGAGAIVCLSKATATSIAYVTDQGVIETDSGGDDVTTILADMAYLNEFCRYFSFACVDTATASEFAQLTDLSIVATSDKTTMINEQVIGSNMIIHLYTSAPPQTSVPTYLKEYTGQGASITFNGACITVRVSGR